MRSLATGRSNGNWTIQSINGEITGSKVTGASATILIVSSSNARSIDGTASTSVATISEAALSTTGGALTEGAGVVISTVSPASIIGIVSDICSISSCADDTASSLSIFNKGSIRDANGSSRDDGTVAARICLARLRRARQSCV